MPDEPVNKVPDKEGKDGEVQRLPSSMLVDNFPPPTARAARDAINLLNIRPFFTENNLNSIFKKLEECDRYAEASAEFNGEMMFIAMSLPIINGIIHIASDRSSLRRATDWVVENWKEGADKDPDKVSILSALTLIYLANEGWQTFKNDPEKRAVWKRIIKRVQKLSTDPFDDDVD